jgi:CRP-like cAMP-binding protein
MPDKDAILQKIKTLFREEHFPAKALLVEEGTVSKKVFYIEKGCARIWFDKEGIDVTFQFLFEGQFISSFESILSGSPSWYSIESLEPITVYSISTAEFRQKMEAFSHVSAFYHDYVQQQLLYYQQLFVSYIKNKPEERYRDLLRQHPEIVRRIPQHYIASYLGITSVSLSRIRNRK